jgi:hypothetical protein
MESQNQKMILNKNMILDQKMIVHHLLRYEEFNKRERKPSI